MRRKHFMILVSLVPLIIGYGLELITYYTPLNNQFLSLLSFCFLFIWFALGSIVPDQKMNKIEVFFYGNAFGLVFFSLMLLQHVFLGQFSIGLFGSLPKTYTLSVSRFVSFINFSNLLFASIQFLLIEYLLIFSTYLLGHEIGKRVYKQEVYE